MKIGIVQTAPQTADFPANLRAVVQGYRDCIDRGAEFVVADAFALCGPCPGDLKQRSSFLNQTQAALKALAAEIGAVPLLLGAYAPDPAVSADEDDFWDVDALLPETAPDDRGEDGVSLMPYLLEQDTVSLALDEAIVLENGLRLLAACGEEVDAFGFDADVLVALPETPWYAGIEAKSDELHSWGAKQEGKPVVCVRPAGGSDGRLWGGGSTVHAADGRLLARLPLFEAASRVVDDPRPKPVAALPEPASLLRRALHMGLKDHVLRNGYEGAAVVLDGRPHALLLAVLAADALGGNVVLLSGEEPSADVAGLLKQASLDERLVVLPNAALPPAPDSPGEIPAASWNRRLLMAQAAFEAEKKGLMPLGSLCRGELLEGKNLEPATGTLLLPFGDLYEGDLRLISLSMREEGLVVPPFFAETPDEADTSLDRAFQLLEDGNRSATELLEQPEFPLDEAVMRKAQRLLIASAWKRRCLPPSLSVTAENARRRYPAMHRLND